MRTTVVTAAGQGRKVAITSERGRDCTVQDPWLVLAGEGRKEILTGARFTSWTGRGKTLELEKERTL
jgi:hypothetical protein